jgi:hypothetical protein
MAKTRFKLIVTLLVSSSGVLTHIRADIPPTCPTGGFACYCVLAATYCIASGPDAGSLCQGYSCKLRPNPNSYPLCPVYESCSDYHVCQSNSDECIPSPKQN